MIWLLVSSIFGGAVGMLGIYVGCCICCKNRKHKSQNTQDNSETEVLISSSAPSAPSAPSVSSSYYNNSDQTGNQLLCEKCHNVLNLYNSLTLSCQHNLHIQCIIVQNQYLICTVCNRASIVNTLIN